MCLRIECVFRELERFVDGHGLRARPSVPLGRGRFLKTSDRPNENMLLLSPEDLETFAPLGRVRPGRRPRDANRSERGEILDQSADLFQCFTPRAPG